MTRTTRFWSHTSHSLLRAVSCELKGTPKCCRRSHLSPAAREEAPERTPARAPCLLGTFTSPQKGRESIPGGRKATFRKENTNLRGRDWATNVAPYRELSSRRTLRRIEYEKTPLWQREDDLRPGTLDGVTARTLQEFPFPRHPVLRPIATDAPRHSAITIN